jgi:predicted RNA binding protein YcfA (HicA-like mRNA interferase family)
VKSYSSKEILQILQQNGWYIEGQKGSHVQFKHPTKRGKVTVPHPRKDLKLITVQTIFRQAGIDI